MSPAAETIALVFGYAVDLKTIGTIQVYKIKTIPKRHKIISIAAGTLSKHHRAPEGHASESRRRPPSTNRKLQDPGNQARVGQCSSSTTALELQSRIP